jgi:methionyl aminopeptidase
MMNAHTADGIRKMEKAGRIAAEALHYTGKFVREGISTEELDQIANDFVLSKGAISACIGYRGYPKAICTSVNSVICHGVPGKEILKAGDIINIDITVIVDGYHGDTSSMFFVGEVSEKAKDLCDCAFHAMHKGIQAAKANGTTGDIGFAIEKYVTRRGYYPVKQIGGHGIGRKFHEEPFVPSFGKKGRGEKLVKWGTITVEPMVNETSAPIEEIEIPGSEITIFKTSDGSLSAQYEHTILITDSEPQILTIF